jgi:hypothetical protein
MGRTWGEEFEESEEFKGFKEFKEFARLWEQILCRWGVLESVRS